MLPELPGRYGGKRAVLRGEHAISRKAIAQGMSDVLRCPVCSCAHSLCTLRMRPRVQRASGIPCALFSERAGDYLQSSGAMRRENANTHSVSSSRTRGPSIPETLVIESRSLGVLDARLRGHDTGGDGLTRGLE